MAAPKKKQREVFGQIDTLPSKRLRARYTAPDGRRIAAPSTFATITAARAWLSRQQAAIAGGTWQPPEVVEATQQAEAAEATRRAITVGAYADKWIRTRTNSKGEPIAAKTRYDYELLWKPAGRLAHWRDVPISSITPEQVRDWHAEQLATGKLTATARAYDLLKSVLKTAVEDDLIPANPCRVKGASRTATGQKRLPPTEAELTAVIAAMPAHLQPLVILVGATGLRYGEAVALRAGDVAIERDEDGDVDLVRVTVERAVTYTPDSGRATKAPKSEAGVRQIAVFGADARRIAAYVETIEGDTMLFRGAAGGPLPHASFMHHWEQARETAGRPDLALHALRHYDGTRHAQAGATLKETMSRLGHSSVSAAMRYQHAGTRDDELARRMAR